MPGQVRTRGRVWGGGRDFSPPRARTVVRLPIHSQNRSRQGGREERLEERMEEEREEGSVGRGLQDPPPGSLEMPQTSARLLMVDTVPAHPGSQLGSVGFP